MSTKAAAAMALKINLVVLNYNGRDLLERFLPSIVRAAAESRHSCRVTVLDNCSRDSSRELVESRFPSVTWWESRENRVLCSYNDFAAAVDDDVLVLLNNDLKLEPGFVDPLVDIFEAHEDAFFAASHGNRARAGFRWGILEPETARLGAERAMEERGYTLSAGVAAFDRMKFLELGGFDDLFLPGRYEDVDLCYRGWKRGWKGYYVPESRQEHLGGYSFDREFGHDRTQRIVYRNALLFMIKNVKDFSWLARMLLSLPFRLTTALLMRKGYLIAGFFDAMKLAPRAWGRGCVVRRQFRLSDRRVLEELQQEFR